MSDPNPGPLGPPIEPVPPGPVVPDPVTPGPTPEPAPQPID